MLTAFLFVVTALFAVLPVSARAQTLECPLPPYEAPQLPPEHGFVQDGQFFVSGQDAAVELPDGLVATNVLWSDDGAVALIEARGTGFDYRVFSYSDSALTELLNQDVLRPVREEDFAGGVELFNPAFVPGTHTVLANTQIIPATEGIYFEIPLDLWSLDADSGELSNILPYGTGGQFSIAPDGGSVILMDADSIWQAGLDGTVLHTIVEGQTISLGLGEEVAYPPVVWGADSATFRTLLFPAYDPAVGGLSAPYEVVEFTLGDTVSSTVILSGEAQFIPAVKLAPDGQHVVQWSWDDDANPQTLIISVDAPGSERQTLAEVDVTGGGLAPFLRWLDATHVIYGVVDYNADALVSSWRANLCGETTELEPYHQQLG